MSVAKLGVAVLGEMSLSTEGGTGGAVLGSAVLGEITLGSSGTDTTFATSERMMSYLPTYWHENEEMKQILRSQGIELDSITTKGARILIDAFIATASEERIREWEKWLKLPPTGTLEVRRMTVMRYFSVIAKLNEQAIKMLVASLYNNARAVCKFDDSEIKIVVVPLPEHQTDELDFSIILEQLEHRKPCHIGVAVERAVSNWGDIRDGRLRSWADIRTMKDWDEVIMYIPR